MIDKISTANTDVILTIKELSYFFLRILLLSAVICTYITYQQSLVLFKTSDYSHQKHLELPNILKKHTS